MADKLVSVNDSNYQFPDAVRARIASNLGDAATPEGTSLGRSYSRTKLRLPDHLSENTDFRQIPVVMFHNFASSAVAQGTLKDYLAWGYTPIFYSEAMNWLATGDASNLPDKPIVFTDDDGGQSAYTALFDACKVLGGVKVTYFLVPDWIDGAESSPPNGGVFQESTPMTWANGQEMIASGLAEFQSHTKTHGSLRAITGPGTFTPDLSSDGSGAGADFLYCKQRIEQMIPGTNVQYTAAPYGVVNETAIASLKQAGCKGLRITQAGTNLQNEYDGSGPTAYVLPNSDPFRIPIADAGTFKYIKRANIFGIADVDGNRVQNGRFTQTQRGWTLPTGWAFTAEPLPSGAPSSTGPVLRGVGTAAATGAYHTDPIPVGFWAAFTVDFMHQIVNAPAGSTSLVLDTFVNPGDTTPVSTLTMPSPVGGTGLPWTRKTWYVLGDGTYAWVRPRFVVNGATSSTEVWFWDVKLRGQRQAWH